MSEQEQHQPIQASIMTHPTMCSVCGSDDRVTRYDVYTGHYTRHTVAWCALCLKKVTLFLAEQTLEVGYPHNLND